MDENVSFELDREAILQADKSCILSPGSLLLGEELAVGPGYNGHFHNAHTNIRLVQAE